MQHFKFEDWRIGEMENSIFDVTNRLNQGINDFVKTKSFHQYSSNSELEITWTSLIGWLLMTSMYTNFLEKYTSFTFDFRPGWNCYPFENNYINSLVLCILLWFFWRQVCSFFSWSWHIRQSLWSTIQSWTLKLSYISQVL